MIERYAYTIALAHITMGVESDKWVMDDCTSLFSISDAESNGASPSCIHSLFQLIPKVTILARKRTLEQRYGHQPWETISEDIKLQNAITNWSPVSQVKINISCGHAYQQALLLFLGSTFDSECSSLTAQAYASSVEQTFDKCILFLGSIPTDSAITTMLCWPLAIFGSCARTELHRHIIRQRLESLSSAYASQSVRDTVKLLDILWSDRTSLPANPLSLEVAMKEYGITVLFL